MPHVPGLRSPYDKVGRLVYFGRMLDKIRLHTMGNLPPEYQTNLGDAQPKLNDGRCCRFLGIEYQALVARTLEGETDEDILAWAHAHGTPRTDEECVMWNRFMTQAGWRDDRWAAILLPKGRGYAYTCLSDPYQGAFRCLKKPSTRFSIAETAFPPHLEIICLAQQ